MAKNVETAAATDADILFQCQHCKAALVVSGAGTGLSMHCSKCGKLTAVPRKTKRPVITDPAAQIEEIQRKLTENASQLTVVPKSEEPSANTLAYADEVRGKLTENESQRAEVTGYINQLSIQLHRWQLRLQQLNERKEQLEKELAALKS